MASEPNAAYTWIIRGFGGICRMVRMEAAENPQFTFDHQREFYRECRELILALHLRRLRNGEKQESETQLRQLIAELQIEIDEPQS